MVCMKIKYLFLLLLVAPLFAGVKVNIAVGDSLTASSFTPSPPDTDWFTQLWSQYPAFQPAAAAHFNLAVSGETITQKVTEFSSQVVPHLDGDAAYSSSDTRTVFFLCGDNDIGAGRTGIACYADVHGYFLNVRSHHGKIVALTIPPNNGMNSTQEAERLAFNAAMVADSASYDYLIDLAGNHAWASADGHNMIVGATVDGTHLTPTVSSLIAFTVNSIVSGQVSLLPPVAPFTNPFTSAQSFGVNSGPVPYANLIVQGDPSKWAMFLYNPSGVNGTSHGFMLAAGAGPNDVVMDITNYNNTKVFWWIDGGGTIHLPQMPAGTLKVDAFGNVYSQ